MVANVQAAVQVARGPKRPKDTVLRLNDESTNT